MKTRKFEKKNYVKELVALMRSTLPEKELAKRIDNYHYNDIAEALTCLTENERKHIYRILGAKHVAEIFTYIDDIEKYFNELTLEKAVKVISLMDSDDAVDLIESLDENKREKILKHLDENLKEDVQKIMSYSEDEIGSRITTNYICIHNHLTIGETTKELLKQAGDNDNISTIYVVDDNEKYFGAIDLKDMILARKDDKLIEIISQSYPYLLEHDLIDECMDKIVEYSEDSIPVLKITGEIVGVITSDDIVELVDDEMGEDYAKLGGLTAEEDLKEPIIESSKKRLPWLIILLFLGMAVSSVVGMFESVVAVLPIVICFQSLVLDMAGNVGTQSLAVTIRVLMDEQLTGKQKLTLLVKEVRVGLLNGSILGIMSLAFLGIYIHVFKHYAWGSAFLISACVGVSLLVAMVISSIVGTAIPMIFHKIKIDPAVASGPLITTVNDLVAVVTYYGLALIFLINIFNLV